MFGKKNKVTVCQIDPRDGHLENSLNALKLHIEAEKTDFLLLPEMCFSNWLAADKTPNTKDWAQAIANHDVQIAKLDQFNTKAIMGTRPIIREHGSRRNLAYIWTKDNGAAPLHEKYYLPNEDGYWEHEWYDRGDKNFDLGRALDLRIGVQICTEMWFFEWARHYAAAKADIICIPRATPHGSTQKWLAGGQSVAVCSGAYSLSSNLYCPEGDKANCGGLGWVVDPEGNILAETDVNNPFSTVEIDPEFARSSKSTYPRYVPE